MNENTENSDDLQAKAVAQQTFSRKSKWSWIFYDWANSAFATTVMTAFFPIFFKTYLSHGVDPTVSTARLGVASSVSGFILALISPILGAISDAGSYKKKFLGTFWFLGIVMTISLAVLSKGDWLLACFIFALANLGFGGANAFYDSLLPAVTTPDDVDSTSVAGYAWGYLGGGVLFLLNVVMYQKPELFGLKDGLDAVQWSFVSVGIWWLIFSIPLFLFVEEPKQPYKPLLQNIKSGIVELKNTFSHVKQYRAALTFLIAFFLYNDGVGTTIKMAVDFGLSIGFETADLIKAILLVQFVGFPAALAFSWVAKRFSPKSGIYFCIVVYLLAIAWATQMSKPYEFYLLAAMIGLVQGGIQALSRSYYTRLFPDEKAGEFFGFYNLLGKFSGVIGPLIVSVCGLVFSSSRIGLLGIGILFLAGAYILHRVPDVRFKSEAD